MKIKLTACKGCFVNDSCPLIQQNELVPMCPCSNCLVKGVCEISCEDYDKFEDGYYSEGEKAIREEKDTYKEDTYDSREEYLLKMRMIAGE